jgi:hypothetical protein
MVNFHCLKCGEWFKSKPHKCKGCGCSWVVSKKVYFDVLREINLRVPQQAPDLHKLIIAAEILKEKEIAAEATDVVLCLRNLVECAAALKGRLKRSGLKNLAGW